MKTFKTAASALLLMFVLGLPVFADDVPPPCNPGETHGPPCSQPQESSNDPVAPGQTDTPPASASVAVASLAEIALELLF